MIDEHAVGTGRGGETRARQWRAVLLGLTEPVGPGLSRTDFLDELESLAATDGTAVVTAVVDRLVQVRNHPDPATYPGSGKVAELAELVHARHADLVIADGGRVVVLRPSSSTRKPR
ncbi:HflX-like GTP-binding protein [Streptomyces phaeoluteigriseus]